MVRSMVMVNSLKSLVSILMILMLSLSWWLFYISSSLLRSSLSSLKDIMNKSGIIVYLDGVAAWWNLSLLQNHSHDLQGVKRYKKHGKLLSNI